MPAGGSQLRLVLHDGGLGGRDRSGPFRDDDGIIRYSLDLANPTTKVAAES